MVVYTKRLYEHTIQPSDAIKLSLNIAILSVFYCFIGSLLSYVLYYIFDEYNPDEREWENKSIIYQLSDVSLEIVILALVSFWLVFMINTSAPIIPVPQHFAGFVDTYTTGLFFMYAIFIFLSDLTNKLKYLYETYLANRFDKAFPNRGSLIDMSIHYE